MPRGGARFGAGRKAAWMTPLCGFVVDNTRRLGAAMAEAKQKKLLVERRSEYADIAELQRTLRAKTPLGSSPHPETLEDIQFHFAKQSDGGLELPRYIPAVGLSPIEWGKIYSDVAAAASSHFGRSISRRQVKRCIAEWLKFERSL